MERQAGKEHELASQQESVREEQALERERLRDELKAISLDVLQQTGDSLAQRMTEARRAEEERAAGEMARRAEELKGLVGPVQEKLGRMESEIGRLERERRQAQGELAQMVRSLGEGVGSLRQETGNLVSALRRPEHARLLGRDPAAQRRRDGGDGLPLRLRRADPRSRPARARCDPTCSCACPGASSSSSTRRCRSTPTSPRSRPRRTSERAMHATRHARQTREHISKLAAKGYQSQFDSTPEFVVMFVPSDGIYQAALAQDPALIEYGVQQQVLMATPTTLIGLLWAVHYGWRQELIAESAREIAESARELHSRLGRFAQPLSKVGRQLDSAVSAYNEAVGSFDHRVIPQVRKIEQAGAASEREVSAPPAIETTARAITARLEPVVEEFALGQAPSAPVAPSASRTGSCPRHGRLRARDEEPSSERAADVAPSTRAA